MVKKIDKIRIIDAPKENRLGNNDLLNIEGGINCVGYDICSFLLDNECASFNSLPCGEGSSADINCSSYED